MFTYTTEKSTQIELKPDQPAVCAERQQALAIMFSSPSSHMQAALAQARLAAEKGEVPVGAIVVGPDNAVLAETHNLMKTLHDPTAHAEILAIREAGLMLGNERLTGCDLYVTLEPCTMCAGAISFARIHRLYFAAYDPKGGGVEQGARFFTQPTCHHSPEVYGGIGEREASDMLRQFFAGKRA